MGIAELQDDGVIFMWVTGAAGGFRCCCCCCCSSSSKSHPCGPVLSKHAHQPAVPCEPMLWTHWAVCCCTDRSLHVALLCSSWQAEQINCKLVVWGQKGAVLASVQQVLLLLIPVGRALELGRELLHKWGYRRVDELIWVKTNSLRRLIVTGRTGHWLNHSKEHCLVGYKGRPAINR